ncbi:MAG: TldD/PmbA family protein [Gammaproteobacteria bacterium]|nr:TldD/PmbA family protein [Gammaproteobacteria bacterium]
MREYFEAVVACLNRECGSSEFFVCDFAGESSEFVRLNGGRVVQSGEVVQRYLSIDWIVGRRHAKSTLPLQGNLGVDGPALAEAVHRLRALCAEVEEDPWLTYALDGRSSVSVDTPNDVGTARAMLDVLERCGQPVVGIWAAGQIFRGFGNATGQLNWHETHSFNFDWSLHRGPQQAVKSGYAGMNWDAEQLRARLEKTAEQAASMNKAPLTLARGHYAVYLAPAAVDEIVSLLGWGGFSARAHQTKSSPLVGMSDAGRTLSELVTLTEDIEAGVAPNFDTSGYQRPSRTVLVRDGEYVESLVSPRSAQEFGIETNGAGADESPLSLAMAPGALDADRALEALGTGLFVSHLWYLNYSDRAMARATGMTRFATFWVENGTISRVVEPMRFDETIYNLLGDELVALTDTQELILDPSTYGGRSVRSARVPGALVGRMALTL